MHHQSTDLMPTLCRFPLALPFSISVVQVFEIINLFIDTFYSFVDDNQLYKDEVAKKSVDFLLINILDAKLSERLGSNNLSEIAQITLNLGCLEDATRDIEKVLFSKRYFKHHTNDCRIQKSVKVTLNCGGQFRETRKNAEFRIFNIINGKLEQFLQLSDYEW
jgi:hypothetical protein